MRRMRKKISGVLIVLALLLTAAASGRTFCAEMKTGGGSAGEMTLRSEKTEGWHTSSSGNRYYIKSDGKRAKGWYKISGKYYYFRSGGSVKTGWLKKGGKRYYLDPGNGGARCTGWKKIGGAHYYFNRKNGAMRRGWLTVKGKKYWLGNNGQRTQGWITLKGDRYYFKKKTGIMAAGSTKISGTVYYFGPDGKLQASAFAPDGNYADSDGIVLRKGTLKQLLKTAMQPVGSTMYVLGGGWNEEDTGSGIETVTIGVSPKWKQFFEQQDSSYNYRNTRYQIHNGLDCSGFVGWVLYNVFHTKSGHSGYVMLAQKMASAFAGYGWGSYAAAGTFTDFRAGDVMSSSGHVYLVVGQCADGSVVLVHASPSGVMLSGTPARSGRADSEALQLAVSYMKKYYPAWYGKYPNIARGSSYLTSFARMRWHLSGNCVMTDPEGYSSKTAGRILEDLFSGN